MKYQDWLMVVLDIFRWLGSEHPQIIPSLLKESTLFVRTVYVTLMNL